MDRFALFMEKQTKEGYRHKHRIWKQSTLSPEDRVLRSRLLILGGKNEIKNC